MAASSRCIPSIPIGSLAMPNNSMEPTRPAGGYEVRVLTLAGRAAHLEAVRRLPNMMSCNSSLT